MRQPGGGGGRGERGEGRVCEYHGTVWKADKEAFRLCYRVSVLSYYITPE